MIQRNHMMSAHRLSDVRHSQLLGSLSFFLHAVHRLLREMSATAQTEQPGRGDTSTADSRSYPHPRLFRTNSVRGPKCPVPPWSRTVGEPRPPRGSFIFNAEGKGRERQNPALTNRACSGGTRRVRGREANVCRVTQLQQSSPVSRTPIAVMTPSVMPVGPVSIRISPVTNRRICATNRFAVAVAVPGRVGAEVR
jgi:hypothetical protein